jgi:mono/diheme cytochrome c family protein
MGIYIFDAEGGLELLYRDPEIGCQNPVPLRPRERPPVIASSLKADAQPEGAFFVADVYQGLPNTPRGSIEALRIVGVPPKAQPTMDSPSIGLTRDDPGKFVIGTAPVNEDGSAFFRAPAGVTVFFQALDARGVAVQTMRTGTHVQPGETLGCIGCHEPRDQAPPMTAPAAAVKPPSNITPGPEGTWPLRFDRLVRPVLDEHCVTCHQPGGKEGASDFDLAGAGAYDRLTRWGNPSLFQLVNAAYARSYSQEGQGIAAVSPLRAMFAGPEPHQGLALESEALDRLTVWMDVYAQRLGSFGPAQEAELLELRRDSSSLFAPDGSVLAHTAQAELEREVSQ